MTIFHEDELVTLHHGDCLDVLRTLPDASIDAVVTDPPYDLTSGKKGGSGAASVNLDSPYGRSRIGTGNGSGGFMGKEWDSTGIAFDPATWAECLRVLKPGGHLLSFGGSRTWHRLAVAVEDAGFEIRDSIAWLYGSGFPKSLDVSKAIDKAVGVDREDKFGGAIGRHIGPTGNKKCETCGKWLVSGTPCRCLRPQDEPQTEDAVRWRGWGTALKPAFEPIVVARKPFPGTVAANVLRHGTGALNIDACRVETSDDLNGGAYAESGNCAVSGSLSPMGMNVPGKTVGTEFEQPAGRWPANVILDGSQAEILDGQSGDRKAGGTVRGTEPSRTGDNGIYSAFGRVANQPFDDNGGASRFFPTFNMSAGDWAWEERMANLPTFRYEAKAPKVERPKAGGVTHPTVKPLDLMRWLVRLVTPRGGVVLDPFAGSGTTAEACLIEGFRCVTIEREATYMPVIMARITKPISPVLDFGGDE